VNGLVHIRMAEGSIRPPRTSAKAVLVSPWKEPRGQLPFGGSHLYREKLASRRLQNASARGRIRASIGLQRCPLPGPGRRPRVPVRQAS